MNDIVISKAVKDDAAFIFSCVRNLAEDVNQLDYMSSTKEMIENELFNHSCNSSVLVASQNDKKIGFILYYTTFSTFKGRKGLYIGDLYVIPEYRKEGVGKKLFQSVIDEAIENTFCRVEWYVTNSNENAINFYENLGAKRLANKLLFSYEIE